MKSDEQKISDNDQEINHYTIVEISPSGRFSRFKKELGIGSFKSVFKAIDDETGCEVAWNVIKTHGLTKLEKEKIRDELVLIQNLHHPKIIHFIKAWHNQRKEELVFITEIMTGGSLKQYQKMFKHPHLRVIKNWCRDILEGLNYLHSQKPFPIIHRDLKCENIFVSSSTGDVRIGDLGISTFMKNSHNKTIIGTPQYMAPELYNEHYGTSVDIYSFGLCLLEMCTNTIPYSECRTPLEVCNAVCSGVKPLLLDRILDEGVKEFIELCLLPADQRPDAQKMLNHSFLKINEDDEKEHQPILLKEEEIKGEASLKDDDVKEYWIEINVGFRDLTGKTSGVKLEFWYNTVYDTPISVAEEIIALFKLDPVCSVNLSELIKKKLREARESEIENKGGRRLSRITRYHTLPIIK